MITRFEGMPDSEFVKVLEHRSFISQTAATLIEMIDESAVRIEKLLEENKNLKKYKDPTRPMK